MKPRKRGVNIWYKQTRYFSLTLLLITRNVLCGTEFKKKLTVVEWGPVHGQDLPKSSSCWRFLVQCVYSWLPSCTNTPVVRHQVHSFTGTTSEQLQRQGTFKWMYAREWSGTRDLSEHLQTVNIWNFFCHLAILCIVLYERKPNRLAGLPVTGFVQGNASYG
jgi:hypothetical protein